MRKSTEEQILDPEFLRDARNYAAAYLVEESIQPHQMLDHITDIYRDLEERITDYCTVLGCEQEVWLDMDVFEVPGIEDWLERFCTWVPDHIQPYLTCATRGRAIALTSILRAADPEGTRYWGLPPHYCRG